ncbi:Zinc ABC transporter, periplasmic-binding protein ZnuA [hydrothermal vent metagenome]|uniref:Zinc ABC transporter, periplasmic-binding protein ZnuA n=1 Tax=hydrothermal vent metagenome TaxID=652676 RepID=A0A1W1BQW4_9ZZZZ
MKKILLTTLLLSSAIFAKINVATTYNYLGEVTKTIGGDLVNIDVLANPKLDPHFITPKPSLIGKLRREDMLIINGGQLEIGWLPPLLKSANNAKINVGGSGFLDVSGAIDFIDKPQSVSRAYGDVHPDGNPHFATDINNITPIAKLISMKLSILDPSHQADYEKNYQAFATKMEKLANELKSQYQGCSGKKVVQYHELFNYALKAYGVENVIDIEPLPGISPSSKHTLKVINTIKEQNIKTILQDVYHEKKTAKFIANKTGATVSIVPHDVGAIDEANTLESFYRMVAKRICQ